MKFIYQIKIIIWIFFSSKGNSNEHIVISDKAKKEEAFEYLKNSQTNISYVETILTMWQAAKKPLIALAVLIALFLWTLYLAVEINAGANYEIRGNKVQSLALC